MEKPSEQLDKKTRDLVKDAGLHSPSPEFLRNVMTAVTEEKATAKGYRPLISKKGWFIFMVGLAACFLLLYVFPMGEVAWIDKLKVGEYLSFGDSLPSLELSKTFIYGIGFMALFLLQIPFLKYYIVKRYE